MIDSINKKALKKAQRKQSKMKAKIKKEHNKKHSQWLLDELGVKYEEFNEGYLLVVSGRDFIFDFWPSIGRFSSRGLGPEGRGVFNLIKHCDVLDAYAEPSQ